MPPILFTTLQLTDAVPGTLVDATDSAAFFATVQVGSSVFRVARFVNGVPDSTFVSELPPAGPAASYVFTTLPTDVIVAGLRVDNGGQDLVVTWSIGGTVNDVARQAIEGGTNYPLPTADFAQYPDRTLKIIAPALVPAPPAVE